SGRGQRTYARSRAPQYESRARVQLLWAEPLAYSYAFVLYESAQNASRPPQHRDGQSWGCKGHLRVCEVSGCVALPWHFHGAALRLVCLVAVSSGRSCEKSEAWHETVLSKRAYDVACSGWGKQRVCGVVLDRQRYRRACGTLRL